MKDNQLAFIGLGAMGGGMAARLQEQGYALTVYNRTAAKADQLVAGGALRTDSPEEAARGHRVVALSLSDERAVEDVLFERIVPVLTPGAYIVDTSTVSPGYARQAAARLADAGLHRVETCVVGNPLQARKGELRVFTAGEEADLAEVRPVHEALGSEIVHLGAPGTAAARQGAAMPVLEAVRERFAAVVEAGDGNKDASVLVEHPAKETNSGSTGDR